MDVEKIYGEASHLAVADWSQQDGKSARHIRGLEAVRLAAERDALERAAQVLENYLLEDHGDEPQYAPEDWKPNSGWRANGALRIREQLNRSEPHG